MTKEKAISELDTMWKLLTSAYDEIADSHVVAYTTAVDALKKQIPQKILPISGHSFTYRCPVCGQYIGTLLNTTHTYCMSCGQALEVKRL